MTIRIQDKYYAKLILGILTNPWDHQKAYTYGIIDAEGKIKKTPGTMQEKESYTPLHQLCFGVKRILEAFPGAQNKLRILSIAMNRIKNLSVPEMFKENYEFNEDYELNFDSNQFLTEMLDIITNEYILVEEELIVNNYLSGKYLTEDGEAPTNSTVGIDIHTPVIDKMFRRKKNET